MFDRAAAHRVALADAAVARHLELRHHEQRDTLGAGRRVRQLGQHQVDDVGNEVVLAGGDEDLGAGDRVLAVGDGLGTGLEQAEVGAAVRFGQAHGAGPAARHQRLQEHRLLPVLAVGLQRLHRAVAEHREVAPGQVGGIHQLRHHPTQQRRHALAAVLGRVGQAGPTAFHERIERLLEARWRGDAAGGLVEAATDVVADLVERGQHGFREARGLVQHGVGQLAVDLGKAECFEVRFGAKDVVQGEAEVVEGGFVGAHARASGQGRADHRPAEGFSIRLRMLSESSSVGNGLSAAPRAARAPATARSRAGCPRTSAGGPAGWRRCCRAGCRTGRGRRPARRRCGHDRQAAEPRWR